MTALPGTEPVPQHDPGSALAPGWHHGAFMQVFVRAYRDADGDGVGDLRGLAQSLDYLQHLGVRGLWLMPIHPSEDGDHGYAVTDYRAIDPAYGTLDDFDALLREAHARGIGVIIDYVINHSASTHPLFGSPQHRDWYLRRDPPPAGWTIYGADPWRRDEAGGAYFAAFSRRMPDFDWRHPGVAAWHHDNLRFWLNRGVDGFRFDAVGHLVENGPDAWDCQPENYPIMAAIRRLLDGYERRFMVCEAPGDPQGFARVAGSAFAFDINQRFVDAARGDPEALAAVARYFTQAPPSISTMLSNHDAFAGARVHDQLGGDLARMKLAAALYLLMPGTPFIYYGEEVGMAGHPALGADPGLRTPMSWCALGRGFSDAMPFRPASPNAATHNVAAQRDDACSLHAFYRALLALRNARRSLAEGDYRVERLDGPLLVVRRRHGDELTEVVLRIDDGALPAPPAGARPLLDEVASGVAVYALSPAR